MKATIITTLNGGDAVTAKNDLIYRIYGSADGYTTPIHTSGSHTSDADVTVSGDSVTIVNVEVGTEYKFKIGIVDEAGNESILSAFRFGDNFSPLVLLSGVKMVQSGLNVISDTSGVGTWGAYGVMNAYIPAGEDGTVRMSLKDISQGPRLLGLKTTNTVQGYTDYPYGVFNGADGNYHRVAFGASYDTDTLVATASGDMVEIGRIAGNLVIRHSTDGATFTQIHNYGAVPDKLYIMVSANGNSIEVNDVRGQGLLS